MLGLYLWCIIIIVIAWALMPWWFIPACILALIISFFFPSKY